MENEFEPASKLATFFHAMTMHADGFHSKEAVNEDPGKEGLDIKMGCRVGLQVC